MKPTRESALDITIKGSVGTFSIGSLEGSARSVEVQYFLTHVGLDSLSSGSGIIKHLAPVREIFDYEKLDFDQLMQRDIDDARVSGELIPYLLDNRSRDLVKLFPPIIVIVLPVQPNSNQPARYYPEVTTLDEDVTGEEYAVRKTTAGKKGAEVFQFEQPLVGDELFEHDLVQLKLNSNKCRLVIVDGQHRAMALLALYRNLNELWSNEKRAPFKDYYEEWTPDYIREFDIENISLPIMFCTFPSLDETYEGEMSIEKAARSVFLTLNKNARPVSNSRNILLDDSDLISVFLRSVLSQIKSRDARHEKSTRIWAIELDQAKERSKVGHPLALAGVNGVYYAIEHLMLCKSEDVNGARPRSGKFYNRNVLNELMARLDGENLLGATEASATGRSNFTDHAAESLSQNFDETYGAIILAFFDDFLPYTTHTTEGISLEKDLVANGEKQLLAMLYQGQGISRVYADHIRGLEDRLSAANFSAGAPEMETVLQKMRGTWKRYEERTSAFSRSRAEKLLGRIANKKDIGLSGGGVPDIFQSFIASLYSDRLFATAFQTAVLATFFEIMERAGITQKTWPAKFAVYIQKLNGFFAPTRAAQLKSLIAVFKGRLEESSLGDLEVAPSRETFSQIVYRGEMQPDQWPKYKYLLLELWRPEDAQIEAAIKTERDLCRKQIYSSLLHSRIQDFMQEASRREEDLSAEERREIANTAHSDYKAFLRHCGVATNDIPTKTVLSETHLQHDDEGDD